MAASSNAFGRTPRASTASGRKSRTTSSLWGSNPSEIICAISEARGISPTVGLALVNITTGEAVLSQICDTQFYVETVNKILMYEPSTILIVNTAFPPNPKSNLLSIVEEELPDTTIAPLDRKYWSEKAGLEFIQTLVFREDFEAINVAIEAAHSLRIRYQPSENTMMIDVSTIQSLELIQNLHNAKSKDCLFGLLNETLTPMGSRMLRSNILEPSCQVENILIPRYDALDELTIKEDMFFEIRKALKNFTDAEKLLTTAINDVLSVKAFVNAVPLVYEALAAARTDLLTRIRQICRPELIQHVADLITSVINDDAIAMKSALDMRNQRTFAVKSGVHGLLDVARQTYKEANEDVHQLVDDINNSSNETVMLSDKVIQELLDGIRVHVPHLFKVCEGIGLLDMIASFGQSVTTRDYVRPEVGDTLALKAARHPICERLNPEHFVPNEVFASAQHRFQIVMGCNMSGKSTYMRMISLQQVMAQIGCFVPAQNVNEKSLTIIDELGRGTSTRDGLAIAIAISEALIQSNSLVWFATHFQQLVTMLYKIKAGPVEGRSYGLDLARAIGFPHSFMETAEYVAKTLEETTERKKEASQSRALLKRRKLILNLHEALVQLRNCDMDDDALGSYMKRLQDEFITRMGEIEGAVQGRGSESIEEAG
ncbi:MutS protein msh4 [Diatrype stigma]|uniref:MutS protein msh4 n=1 Tax=Diatrype stigma TaxID=117547 RepID=A0AAN9UHA7_9PEZI